MVMDAARLASLWAEFKVEHARRYATAEEEEVQSAAGIEQHCAPSGCLCGGRHK